MLAGPISYLLASDAFDRTLDEMLRENVPEKFEGRKRALAQVDEIMSVLRQRKDGYRRRRPGIVNLIAASEMERFMRNGLIGRLDLPEEVLAEHREAARAGKDVPKKWIAAAAVVTIWTLLATVVLFCLLTRSLK